MREHRHRSHGDGVNARLRGGSWVLEPQLCQAFSCFVVEMFGGGGGEDLGQAGEQRGTQALESNYE